MRRLIVLSTLVVALVVALGTAAAAHNVTVTTPGGTLCQFLGGPGNPGHAGHGAGHPSAIAGEGSDVVTIAGGAACMSGVGPG